MIEIGEPEISSADGEAILRFPINGMEQEVLFYSVPEIYGSLLSEMSDAALLALIWPAMAAGQDIKIRGRVSERLVFNLAGPAQDLLRRSHPSLGSSKLDAPNLYSEAVRPKGVATGFSGGVDSFATIADFDGQHAPEGFRLSHLLYNNVGAHFAGNDMFQRSLALAQSRAARLDLPLVPVNSNLRDFYVGCTFQQTHSPRNASVALALQNGIGRFLYASTYSYDEIFVGQTYDIAYQDPILLPLFSTEGCDVVSVGSEYSRVEKTLRLTDLPVTRSTLEVCVREGARNCSDCWKCRRTLLTLEIAGLLEQYTDVFDLRTYNAGRMKFIAKVFQSKDPLAREIIAFGRARGFPFPPHAVIAGRMVGAAKSILRKAAR